MTLKCPRDGTELAPSQQDGVPCDACSKCNGAWFSLAELEALEATVASEAALAGTLEYAKHPDDLKCPSCGKPLQGFDFRGEDLELDACDDEHAFWLDAGEAARVRELMTQRRRDLERAGRAESAWTEPPSMTSQRYHDREHGFKPTLTERLERLILGGPRRR